MTAVRGPRGSVAPPVALGAPAVAQELLRRGPTGGTLGVGTLGPAGTSADEAARALLGALRPAGCPGASVDLHDTFAAVRHALHERSVTCALVPSAFSGATDFHWDPGLELVGVIVQRTPDYGLAARTDDDLGHGHGPGHGLVVAALPEVAGLVEELAPGPLLARRRELRVAASTADAARSVAERRADVAVCNDTSRRRHGLRWLAARDGVPMPWSVFVPREAARGSSPAPPRGPVPSRAAPPRATMGT